MTARAIPLILVASLVLVSCGAPPPPRNDFRDSRPLYKWQDDGGPGEVKVRINLSSQRAYYTRGGRPIGWSFVATGREGHKTPAGSYKITEKVVDKYSNRYGWIENEWGETIDHDASPGDSVPAGGRYVAAPMPYWMRLTSYGIGMHAGHIPSPGEPASHGCIRLPKPLAPLVYDVVKVGTPVVIEYGPAADPYEVLPAGDSVSQSSGSSARSVPSTPPPPSQPRTRDGLRVVSPDDPNIIWPDNHPFAGRNRWRPHR